ncbi:MAG: hypothetical protein ACKV1O_07965 [Saprospiraceae bacterium]
MLQLGVISHPNPIVDKKVKYFHDCFHYCLTDSAKWIDGFSENHLTLLERMLFRVDTVSQMHQSSRMAICALLEQPEFDINKDKFSKQTVIKPLINKLKHIARQKKDQFDLKLFRETAIKIIEELNGAEGLDGSLYFHKILKSQISLLTCVHDLKKHDEEIMKHSRWMVAEYIRLGFDPTELSGLDSIFKRIMSFDELKTSSKPHTVGFPLPMELKQDKDLKKFKLALKKYLKTNLFVAQFEGMLNALKENQNGQILFRVNGITLRSNDRFEFSYAGVTFLNSNQVTFDSLSLSESLRNDFEEYFGAPNTIITRIPMLFKSKAHAITMAKFQANRALDALRYVLDERGGHISTNRVIIAWPSGGADYQMYSERYLNIDQDDIEILKKLNQTIPYPDNISPEVRRHLEQCNRIFFKGIACEEPDDIISHFWQYWETTFSFYQGKGKADSVINDLSIILSKDRYSTTQIRLGLLIHNYAINNNGNTDIGIPSTYYGTEFNFDNPAESVETVKGYTNYPFLKKLIERFECIDSYTEDMRWQKSYKDFLWQLYEQRNFILHDGKYCSATLERLKFFFKAIVVRWQAKLFEEIEKVPNSTVKDAVAMLKTKS